MDAMESQRRVTSPRPHSYSAQSIYISSPLLELGGEMFQRVKTASSMPHSNQLTRPESQVTDDYTEFEDGDSDSEDSIQGSGESMESRRRSDTTISSYDEALTPKSEIDQSFEIRLRPVEGPSGPHLFRASQSSAEFTFDAALQLSPIEAKELPPRTCSGLSQDTVKQQRPEQFYACSPLNTNVPGLPRDVYDWTPQDVVDWMYNIGIELPLVERFEKHDISGPVLMDLQYHDLKELGIESFGKRHVLWHAVESLKGGERYPSPIPTPFQDISRPCTNVRSKSDGDVPTSACPDTPVDDTNPPISAAWHKKRRARKHRHQNDVVTPAESVSIVAIEQLMPKPHKCSKGENCSKWRKQQRLIARVTAENGWPVSPTNGGHIMITGDPGNASTAENIHPNVHRPGDHHRPMSEAVPSVVASSDLLGPGLLPAFNLHENMLQRLEQRDPQENVKQFLTLQHVNAPSVEEPPTPPFEMFPEMHHQMFPSLSQPATPSLQRPYHTQEPHGNLKHLPKLTIPRAATASPFMASHSHRIQSPASALSPCRSATASPATACRYGSPVSTMNMMMTQQTLPPLKRDASQSVPPNMQFREPVSLSRSLARTDWRRPSFAMPALDEDQVFASEEESTEKPINEPAEKLVEEPTSAITAAPGQMGPNMPPLLSTAQSQYGIATTHAGWMKKRKTKLLRHDWQDAHFRLRGTQLAMHATSRHSDPPLETLNTDDYAVACSSVAGNSKISAALKSLKIRDGGRKDGDGTSFAFQLIPASASGAAAMAATEAKSRRRDLGVGGNGASAATKTHHFAVKSRDERIDWMRELMIAKALRQKERGYEVEVNGRA